MSSPWSRRRGTATSLTAVSDRPGLVGRRYCPLRSLPGSPDGGQGLSIDVLPCYLCACMLATGICHVFPPWPRGRGCVSIWPWVMSVTQGRDGEGNREIRGRQPMFSIHISWQKTGVERGESSPEVPGRITVIPAGIQRPAKVAGQYGLGVLFFWSNSHNSTSIPSRVHGLHGMACYGGKGTYATGTRSMAPSCKHSRSKLHTPCWAPTRSHGRP